MITEATSNEHRRAQRKRVDFTTLVTDVISGRPFGELGNISATGLLLIGPQPPRKEALYQLRLALPGLELAAQQIELGVQEQWHERAAAGQVWAGYRIIAISADDAARLDRWLALPAHTY